MEGEGEGVGRVCVHVLCLCVHEAMTGTMKKEYHE